jgi:hypothetical protein
MFDGKEVTDLLTKKLFNPLKTEGILRTFQKVI